MYVSMYASETFMLTKTIYNPPTPVMHKYVINIINENGMKTKIHLNKKQKPFASNYKTKLTMKLYVFSELSL